MELGGLVEWKKLELLDGNSMNFDMEIVGRVVWN
jgi:hypothetical protein